LKGPRSALWPRSRKGVDGKIDEQSRTAQAVQDDFTPEELAAAIEASVTDFKEGDILEGTIVKVDRDEVLVDIGYKSEGVIPSKELSIRQDVDPSQIVNIGDQVEALVLQKEDK
jgi:small subunit ribosomal protein S1